jgi:hypothetical protein
MIWNVHFRMLTYNEVAVTLIFSEISTWHRNALYERVQFQLMQRGYAVTYLKTNSVIKSAWLRYVLVLQNVRLLCPQNMTGHTLCNCPHIKLRYSRLSWSTCSRLNRQKMHHLLHMPNLNDSVWQIPPPPKKKKIYMSKSCFLLVTELKRNRKKLGSV